MNTRTLRALEDSIKHWEDNVLSAKASEYFRLGANVCPLCRLFNIDREMACEGCPVKDQTGEAFCRETPYAAVYNARSRFYPGSKPNQDLIDACEKELDFLKSLLPKEMENQ